MKLDVLLIGVGGEGVLTAQVVIARAANLEGYFVRGVQLHGLAQRGGSIPTMVRFGSENKIFSPGIMEANADLILAFEPLEAVRAVYYARKEKTIFAINDYPYVPVYSYVLGIPYLSIAQIKERVTPFAKEIHLLPASKIAKKEFGDPIFGNTVLLGAVKGLGILPLKKENLVKAIKVTISKELEENLEAFERGIKLGKTLQDI